MRLRARVCMMILGVYCMNAKKKENITRKKAVDEREVLLQNINNIVRLHG